MELKQRWQGWLGTLTLKIKQNRTRISLSYYPNRKERDHGIHWSAFHHTRWERLSKSKNRRQPIIIICTGFLGGVRSGKSGIAKSCHFVESCVLHLGPREARRRPFSWTECAGWLLLLSNHHKLYSTITRTTTYCNLFFGKVAPHVQVPPNLFHFLLKRNSSVAFRICRWASFGLGSPEMWTACGMNYEGWAHRNV